MAPLVVEIKRFGLVLTLVWQVGDDPLRRAARDEFTGGVLVAVNVLVGGVVEPAVMEEQAGAAALPEFLHDVRATVAVGVTQRQDWAALGLRIDVAIGCDRDEAQVVGAVVELAVDDEVVGEHQCAKTRRQQDAAVVGVGCGQGRGGVLGAGGQSEREQGDDEQRRFGHGNEVGDSWAKIRKTGADIAIRPTLASGGREFLTR